MRLSAAVALTLAVFLVASTASAEKQPRTKWQKKKAKLARKLNLPLEQMVKPWYGPVESEAECQDGGRKPGMEVVRTMDRRPKDLCEEVGQRLFNWSQLAASGKCTLNGNCFVFAGRPARVLLPWPGPQAPAPPAEERQARERVPPPLPAVRAQAGPRRGQGQGDEGGEAGEEAEEEGAEEAEEAGEAGEAQEGQEAAEEAEEEAGGQEAEQQGGRRGQPGRGGH